MICYLRTYKTGGNNRCITNIFLLQKFQQLPNLGLFRVTTSESVQHIHIPVTNTPTACGTLALKRSFSNYLKYHSNGLCSYRLSQGISVVENALYMYAYHIAHAKTIYRNPPTHSFTGERKSCRSSIDNG